MGSWQIVWNIGLLRSTHSLFILLRALRTQSISFPSKLSSAQKLLSLSASKSSSRRSKNVIRTLRSTLSPKFHPRSLPPSSEISSLAGDSLIIVITGGFQGLLRSFSSTLCCELLTELFEDCCRDQSALLSSSGATSWLSLGSRSPFRFWSFLNLDFSTCLALPSSFIIYQKSLFSGQKSAYLCC